MNLVIPETILQKARMSAQELKQEIAIMLFEKDKLTLGQAARLAEITRLLQFQHILASRAIPVHYDMEQFQQDLTTFNSLRNTEKL